MIKKKITPRKFLSILFIICFLFTTFSSLSVKAEGTNPSLATDVSGEYVINSIDDINKFRTDLNNGIDYGNKKVVLASDITINAPLTPTTGTFQGYFNGQGHSIKNYNDPLTGFVCELGNYGVITNLHMSMNVSNVTGLYDSGSYEYGSIANQSAGTISLCSVDGIITTDKNESSFFIGGIVSDVTRNDTNCIVEKCYSRLEIEADNTNKQYVAGIAYSVLSSYMKDYEAVRNCYVAGKMVAKKVCGIANRLSAYYPSCYYDKDIVKATKDTLGGVAKSTDEMKQQTTYTGWDFDKIWDIKSDTNDGYPYLKPNQTLTEPITMPADMTVDVNINIKDKTVNSDGTADLTADYTTSLTCSDQDSIASYNVNVTLPGKISFPGFTGQNVSMTYKPVQGQATNLTSDVLKNYLKITYDDNKKYKFKIGNVTFNTPNFNGNGITTVSEDKQKEQIANAKKAEDILYSKLGVGQGSIPEFTWSGDKTSINGKDGTTEGSVELNDYVWEVFSSARSGYSGVRAGFYDDWFKSVQDGLKKMKEAGVTPRDVKMTEWDKLVLAITAIGYDPRDIEAYDLIDIISNEDYLSTSNETFSSQYALLGLNSYNYAMPSNGTRIDRESLIHGWVKSALGNKGADGSEVLSNAVSDMWTMTFQPIASYYGKEGYSDVTKAMDQVFAQFSNAQTYKGSFWGGMSGDYNNSWTNAQVYMTLGMAKSNIFDSKYIKNGNSILDGALEFYNIKDGTTTFDKSSYEPTQMCRGLDSLVRAYEGRNSIFDCTDVKNSTVPVNNAIAQLPDADKVTSADKDKVDSAEKLYDALSDAQKSSMKQETVDKLTAAEKKVSPSQTVKVTGVTLDKTSASMPEGDTLQITAAVSPDNATNTKVDWSSSDKIIASVDGNGKVTAVKAGTVTITAVSEDNKDAKAQCTVTVNSKQPAPQPVSVTGVSLDNTSASLTEGDTLQLTAAILPKDAANTKVDWSSSDPKIAAVDGNGKVTAVKAGTAVITAVSEDNRSVEAQCIVTVASTPKAIQITNLTKDSSFKLGEDAKVSVKAENNSGKDQDESLIVALYDEGGKFINYVCGKQTIKNGDSSILTGIMKLPEEGIYKLKAFVWDSLENMNPLSDIIDIPVQSNK